MAYRDVRSALAVSVAVCAVAMASPAWAQTRTFDVPAQAAATGIPEFARQADIQILVSESATRGRSTRQVRGRMPVDRALRRLIEGTGLRVASGDGRTFTLAAAATPGSREAQDGGAPTDSESATQQEIVVTGSNIRGVSNRFSPVTSVTRQEIDEAGFSNTSQVISSLPQNFNGGAGGSLALATGTSVGGPGTTTVNLRGLSNATTLILINGRRFPSSGENGILVDVSAIPIAALDRVEVLTDGASAIYGSDAVAGVTNFILRRDYNGAETRLRVGGVTNGNSDEFSFAQTMGTTWDGGRVIASYEHSFNEPLRAEDRSFSSTAPSPNYLIPRTRRDSLFGSLVINVTPSLEISTDAYFTSRETETITTLSGRTYYADTSPQQFGITTSGRADLGRTWSADLALSYATSRSEAKTQSFLVSTGAQSTDVEFSPKGRFYTADLQVSGDAFSVGGNAARLVIGGQARRETFRSLTTNLGSILTDTNQARNVYAGFGELYVPLISRENNSPIGNSLAISLAGRMEHYSDVGSAFSPKVGILYSPFGGLTIRSTWSRSFHAATLSQLVNNLAYALLVNYRDQQTPQTLGIYLIGSNPDLTPERSNNYSIGVDISPIVIPGFNARLTYYYIDYRGRIAIPRISYDPSTNTYYNNLGPVDGATPSDVQDIISRAAQYLDTVGASPDGATVIVDGRPQNAARTRLSGLDFDISYRFPLGAGAGRVFARGTYYLSYKQTDYAGGPTRSLLDQFGQPADLRIRGGLGYASDAWSLNGFINYTGSYRDARNPLAGERPVGSWTTFDLSLGYTVPTEHGIFAGLSANLVIRNIFNEMPPFVAPVLPSNPYAYDPSNADPYGRQFGVQLIKRW